MTDIIQLSIELHKTLEILKEVPGHRMTTISSAGIVVTLDKVGFRELFKQRNPYLVQDSVMEGDILYLCSK